MLVNSWLWGTFTNWLFVLCDVSSLSIDDQVQVCGRGFFSWCGTDDVFFVAMCDWQWLHWIGGQRSTVWLSMFTSCFLFIQGAVCTGHAWCPIIKLCFIGFCNARNGARNCATNALGPHCHLEIAQAIVICAWWHHNCDAHNLFTIYLQFNHNYWK